MDLPFAAPVRSWMLPVAEDARRSARKQKLTRSIHLQGSLPCAFNRDFQFVAVKVWRLRHAILPLPGRIREAAGEVAPTSDGMALATSIPKRASSSVRLLQDPSDLGMLEGSLGWKCRAAFPQIWSMRFCASASSLCKLRSMIKEFREMKPSREMKPRPRFHERRPA